MCVQSTLISCQPPPRRAADGCTLVGKLCASVKATQWVQNRYGRAPKVTPRYVQNRFQKESGEPADGCTLLGELCASVRAASGSRMGPERIENGYKMQPQWIQNGPTSPRRATDECTLVGKICASVKANKWVQNHCRREPKRDSAIRPK